LASSWSVSSLRRPSGMRCGRPGRGFVTMVPSTRLHLWRNSPFTGALVKHLLSSNEEIMPLLREVRVEVIRETNRRQVPWEHTALTSGFYFKTGANPPPPPSIPNPVLPALAAPQMNTSDLERSRVAFNQGKAAYERKDFDRAIPDFTETIRLEPNNSEGFYNRGLAYAQKGRF
jgi:tetratricopeptide (TPR) repeat protein